jgi:RNA polymerase sigma-70 factor (TIGR02960 family)
MLEQARAGQEQAYRALVEPYRRELQVHCYRMTGSLTDAEDLLQETLLAAWRGLPGFQQRSSLRSWLYRIATNQCLNALRGADRRAPASPVPPFQPPEPTQRGEVTWLQPYPDALLKGIADPAPGPEARYQAIEAIELAFVAGLQRMPPRQAATLVLRDVLGYPLDEVADMLGTSPAAVKGTLQRARAAMDRHHGQTGRPAPRPSSARERAVARRFADAYVAADIDQVIALLTDDAWLTMPPAPHEYRGTAAIRSFLEASFGFRGERRIDLVPTSANTQPALASYVGDPDGSAALPGGLFVLTLAGERIHAVTRFHVDELYPRFGLPESLPLSATRPGQAATPRAFSQPEGVRYIPSHRQTGRTDSRLLARTVRARGFLPGFAGGLPPPGRRSAEATPRSSAHTGDSPLAGAPGRSLPHGGSSRFRRASSQLLGAE